MIKDGKYLGSVKVGPKCQIVIPKEIRDMFGISPGDRLVILADAEKGIAIERFSVFSDIADKILGGYIPEGLEPHSEQETLDFAKAIKTEEANECDKNS